MNEQRQIGVSPLSWINDVLEDLGRETPVEQFLDEVVEAGYAGVELGRKLPKQPKELSNLLQPRGLQLASGWYSGMLAEGTADTELESVDSHASVLAEMDCRVMVYGECGCMASPDPLDQPMSNRLPLDKLELVSYADRISAFAQKIKERYGLKVSYHPHLMMVAERQDEVDSLFAELDAETGLLLDTGHCVAGDGDIAALIDNWGDRINHVHLKDVRQDILQQLRDEDESFNTGVRRGMFTVPGDGNIDFNPVVQWLNSSSYSGWLVVEAEQDPKVANPLQMVTKARQFLRDNFNQ